MVRIELPTAGTFRETLRQLREAPINDLVPRLGWLKSVWPNLAAHVVRDAALLLERHREVVRKWGADNLGYRPPGGGASGSGSAGSGG